MKQILPSILRSWSETEHTCYTLPQLLEWIDQLNQSLTVHIVRNRLSDSSFWFYDEAQGCIRNQNNSFFSIWGLEASRDGQVLCQQPVILQDEIGYLGILCKELDGVLHFLMQAKIEPGNLNQIQISPTIQATKSNFTQKHGGGRPPYLDYFLQSHQHQIVVDQIQSEQSSRFYRKRNRNLILYVTQEVELLPSHRWMTLGQIKALMRYDNLVNMDTRTVLSCIPFSTLPVSVQEMAPLFRDQALCRSIFDPSQLGQQLPPLYAAINDYKMFHGPVSRLIPLRKLTHWSVTDDEIVCHSPYSFRVIYCDIEVEGREVRRWTQPLVQAEGIALFALYTCVYQGKRLFLVHLQPEVGCFDSLELGPTLQRESIASEDLSPLEQQIFDQIQRGEGLLCHVLLSEEGGRFYHEQNRNVILETDYFPPPSNYFWLDFYTLNLLTQVNNCLNIQLRNLISLLEV